MKCPKCNEDVENGTKFCTKCGANVEEAKKTLVEKKVTEEAKAKKENPKPQKDDSKKTEGKKEETKKDETAAQKDNPENLKKESEKEQKPKKKSSKKKIILIISIIVVLLAGTVAGLFIYFNNQEEEEEEVLEWGDIYLEILKDDDNLDDLENMEIGLIDLDQDTVPELIIRGINSAKEIVATVFKINDKNEVDTLNIIADEDDDLTFQLVYDLDADKYVWYGITNQDSDEPSVYNLNIESGKYEQELLDIDYKNDLVIVETQPSQMIEFSKELSKSERKDKFDEAKESYVSTEDMITAEVEEKVELAKAIKNIEKIDSSKDLVYSVVSKTINGYLYEYPCININSTDAKEMNDEIEEEYGFKSTISQDNVADYVGPETEEISYNYTINENILSVVVWEGGNESIWADVYTVDLKTSSKLSGEDVLEQYELNKDEVITKATEAVTDEFESVMQKEKNALSSTWDSMYGTTYESEWKGEIESYIEELKVFVNDENEVCILGEYEHAGGQWSCNQTVVVNITDNYDVSELPFKDGNTFDHYLDNYQEPETSTTPSTSPSSSTSSSSSSSSSNSISDITFTSSSTIVPEGTYERGSNGTLEITNSSAGQFDFSLFCTYMTQAGYPNMGELSGTAKATSDGTFAYVERKSNGDYYDYNVIFTISGNSITIEDEYETSWSPYCGNNVTFNGTFSK